MHSETVTVAGTATETFDASWLDVGQGHRLYYEQAGATNATAALLLHGGPGSGSSPRQRIFLDSAPLRIVQFDQRGCGRSEPLGETAHNHADALIGDIERLRVHLGIDRWLVFGGSWGAALALAYAARHRDHVSGLILRGVFLTGKADLDWFFHGVSALAPEVHARFMAQVPRRWRRSVVTWLDRCFAGADSEQGRHLSAHWQAYETALGGMHPQAGANPPGIVSATPGLRAKYRIQAHYLARKCFLGEAAVLNAAANSSGIPVAIIHGTHDLVCRPQNAWRVHRTCTGSRLAWAAQAGHDPYHPASLHLLRGATRCFATHGDFSAWPDGNN
ncbi:MAG: alpha/beta fold hydrolase [Rudaea sp.]|nr:alpha/beta fold hydrolase [Rudaea sp.]